MNEDPSTAPYRSIAAPVEAELEIRRSRFLCLLTPVSSEEEARAAIAAARALHPRARHHCSALVIGPRAQLQRTNDDGEPSGTAGAPMLDALRGAELSDVVAVVVRYFGGVLLGAGGLTRAYRAAVAEAVQAAEASGAVVTRELRLRVDIETDYATAALIEAEAHRRGWAPLGSEYGAGVSVGLGIAPDQLATLRERVAALSAGAARVTERETRYVTLGR